MTDIFAIRPFVGAAFGREPGVRNMFAAKGRSYTYMQRFG